MTRSLLPASLAVLVSLSACSTIVPRGDRMSPAGQTLRVVAANGAASQMVFRSDGHVIATFGQRSITGDWNLQDEGLCFRWANAAVECWPYNRPFERGRTVTVTSTRGNVVQVTRM